MSIHLFTTFYKSRHSERDAELLRCLQMNCDVASLDCIHVLEEPPHRLADTGKVHVIRVQDRPTFSDLFAAARSAGLTDSDLSIIANSDIIIADATLKTTMKHLGRGECYAVARWDVHSRSGIAKEVCNYHAQDAWLFYGAPDIVADFYMGRPGCDGRIAFEMRRHGYTVLNPSHQVRVFHLHEAETRTYSLDTPSDWVSGPYEHVHPVSLTRRDTKIWWARRLLQLACRGIGIELLAPTGIRLPRRMKRAITAPLDMRGLLCTGATDSISPSRATCVAL